MLGRALGRLREAFARLRRWISLFMTEPHFDWDPLSLQEGEFCAEILRARADDPAFAPIVSVIEAAGGVSSRARDFLFELRFAHALAEAGVPFSYEVAGEGASSIDFGFAHGGRQWRVELVRLAETDAARSAVSTWRDADGTVWSSQVFSSDDEDDRRTEAGETLKAIERLCQKLERDGRPHKFPPVGEATHVLLADAGAFLHGGDGFDRLHIALGAHNVPEPFRQIFRGRPVTGVFDPATRLRGAKAARERLHFIGFVNDETFAPGSLNTASSFVANPHLVADFQAAQDLLSAWPLQPARLLNARR